MSPVPSLEAPSTSRAPGWVGAWVGAAGLTAPVEVRELARAHWPEQPTPEEASLAGEAHPERRAAFAAGRACAHAALAALGVPPSPLLRVADAPGAAARAPAWPAGFVGSITHAAAYCAAVVGRADDYLGVGIDLEAWSRIRDPVLERITTPVERARAATTSDPSARTLPFVAKEAFFKIWSPVARRPLGFRQVEIEPDGSRRFRVHLHRDAGPSALGAGPFEGHYAVSGDLIGALVTVPAP